MLLRFYDENYSFNKSELSKVYENYKDNVEEEDINKTGKEEVMDELKYMIVGHMINIKQIKCNKKLDTSSESIRSFMAK